MKTGIVGAGPMGLALAYRLAKRGHQVTVFERDKQLGGLATYHDYGPFEWDRFYHVILPSDTHLIAFLREIGLGSALRWSRTFTGFYVDRRMHSVSSAWEFLRFPLVSLVGKIRLAVTLLYCSRIRDWKRLERVTAEEWLIKTCGRVTYEKMWRPLLLAKLGENYKRVSAVFIWTYITRLFSARDASAGSKEHLGHVAGGYKTVFDRLENLIRSAGGEIRTEVAVENISACPHGGLWIETASARERYDKVVFTGPVNLLRETAGALLEGSCDSEKVEYLGVICVVLITRKPLVPYYVVNIADPRIPFTGVIGMSNVVSTDETAGLHITYLPKYVMSDDPLLRRPDQELKDFFFEGVKAMFPDLTPEDLVSVHVNRAFKVQPLQVLDYSSLVPQVVTAHEDFFVLNTSQFVNGTLNNNEVIRAVICFLDQHGKALERVNSPACEAVSA